MKIYSSSNIGIERKIIKKDYAMKKQVSFVEFMNRANERVFNDSLIVNIAVEIKLKGALAAETILPTYLL
jgi:hypothetical protein